MPAAMPADLNDIEYDAYVWFDKTSTLTPLPTRQTPGAQIPGRSAFGPGALRFHLQNGDAAEYFAQAFVSFARALSRRLSLHQANSAIAGASSQ